MASPAGNCSGRAAWRGMSAACPEVLRKERIDWPQHSPTLSGRGALRCFCKGFIESAPTLRDRRLVADTGRIAKSRHAHCTTTRSPYRHRMRGPHSGSQARPPSAAHITAHHRGNRNRPPSAKANSVRFPPAAAVRRPNGPRGSPRANRRAQVELPRLATLRLPRAPPPPFPKPHRISARRPWFRRRQKCDASRIIFARTQGQSSNRWRVLF